VEVSSTIFPLQPDELEILLTFIDPKAECADIGVSLYVATKQFVEFCVTHR